MPTIKNKTTQLVCLTSKGGDCIAISPDSSKQVPAELWADNRDMPCVVSMLDDRRLLVIHDPQDRAPEPVAAPRPKPTAEPEDVPGDWSKVHWRKAKRIISATDDVAPLYELLENEERAKIKSMLEARIEELEA